MNTIESIPSTEKPQMSPKFTLRPEFLENVKTDLKNYNRTLDGMSHASPESVIPYVYLVAIAEELIENNEMLTYDTARTLKSKYNDYWDTEAFEQACEHFAQYCEIGEGESQVSPVVQKEEPEPEPEPEPEKNPITWNLRNILREFFKKS